MRRLATFGLLGLIANMTICDIAPAQTTTGSTGCAAITQAGVNGLNARIQADDSNISAPQSVTSLTCLDNFFNGVGLNLVTNLLSPANLLQAVEGKICNLVQQTWNSLLGKVQCGLTVSSFNLGFGGIGGGLSCPKLSFGGGGPPIATISIGTGSTGSGLYIQRHRHLADRIHPAQPPTRHVLRRHQCGS